MRLCQEESLGQWQQGPFFLLLRGYPKTLALLRLELVGVPKASPGFHLPVLKPVLCVLEPGPQVPDANFLLLQRSQVLLWGGGLDAMVVAA